MKADRLLRLIAILANLVRFEGTASGQNSL